MRFERGKDIKKSLRIGKYSELNKFLGIAHEVHGGQIISTLLPTPIAEQFLEALAKGIRLIPSGIFLPDGRPREEYRIHIRYAKGGTGWHTTDISGWVIESDISGEIFEIPDELETKIWTYEL